MRKKERKIRKGKRERKIRKGDNRVGEALVETAQ